MKTKKTEGEVYGLTWKQIAQFENDILVLIDERDNVTRSDLQAMVGAVVLKIAKTASHRDPQRSGEAS